MLWQTFESATTHDHLEGGPHDDGAFRGETIEESQNFSAHWQLVTFLRYGKKEMGSSKNQPVYVPR